ncbi:MAG: hypothetical protein Q7U47_12315 [Paludibacter sp.]|nr:hypothetical protein [Paludibacter sp.]
MKTEKKWQKAAAVIILLAAGLFYNYESPLLKLNTFHNTEFSENDRFNSEIKQNSFITYTVSLIKSGFNNFFNNK